MPTKILKKTNIYWGDLTDPEYLTVYNLDTSDGRMEILDDYGIESKDPDDLNSEEQDFVDGKTNQLQIELDSRDWDDPSGYLFEIVTKEEEIKHLEQNAQIEINKIKELKYDTK